MMVKEILNMFVAPIVKVITNKQEIAAARDAANAKLIQAKYDGLQEITLKDSEIELVRTQGLSESWKDEYVTVSIVSILNLIVAGGVFAALGFPEILEGIGIAMSALHNMGVDFGELLRIVVFAAIGISVWRKV